MKDDDITRRLFLIRSLTGVSGAWLASRMPAIVAAQEHAHLAAQTPTPTKFEFFTPEQAAEVEAVAAQIIPTDDTPGAREARVIYFIDRALTTFDRDNQKEYVKGLAMLKSRTRKVSSKAARFSDLTEAQQIKVLKAIEKTQFFELVRTHTVMGFFANPEHGGNYNQIGWKHIGFEDSFNFKPPFGFYDAEAGKQ